MNFLKSFGKILKYSFLPIFIVYLISNNLEFFLTDQLDHYIKSTTANPAYVWIYAGILFFTGLLFPILTLVLMSFSVFNLHHQRAWSLQGFSDFVFLKLKYLVIENLRAWGKVISWGVLLLIPGFVQFVRMFYVSFVVVLDARYDQGEIDALKTSSELVKYSYVLITLVLVGFELILPMMVGAQFDLYRDLIQFPLEALMLTAWDAFLFIWTMYLVYLLYCRSKKMSDMKNQSAAKILHSVGLV